MASIPANLVKLWFRRQNVFGSGKYDPQAIRQRADGVSLFSRPRSNVQVVPTDAAGVPSEWLIPKGSPRDEAVLYIHGGAWFMGSANTHRGFVSRLAYDAGVRILLINYRLAPEYPFPAGLDDCISTYEWLIRSGIQPSRLVVVGDSAGGNLTLSLLVALRDGHKPLPAAAVAISPATDLAFTGQSVQTRLHLDPIFAHGGPTTIIQDYITSHDPHEPLISPLYADLHGLPALLIHVGDHEILLDDSVRFGKKALEAGVDASTVVWPEMFHVFQLFTPLLPEARKATHQLASFIRSRLGTGNSFPSVQKLEPS